MKSHPAASNFGIEFDDIDLAQVSQEQLSLIQQALNEHGVVFFRHQTLTPCQHVALAQQLGDICTNKFFERLPDNEFVAIVRKEPKHTSAIGETWHSDHSYEPEPAKGSILLARQVPETGGDTLFANMHMAWEALSLPLQQFLEGLRAVHSIAHKYEDAVVQQHDDRFPHGTPRDVSTSVHPVVLVHPVTQRRALFVNPTLTTHFEGWTPEESAPLLQYLFQHSTKPEFVMRFRWQVGSVAYWDNRATMHCACNDYPHQTRIMHRITLKGCPLQGPIVEERGRTSMSSTFCGHEKHLLDSNCHRSSTTAKASNSTAMDQGYPDQSPNFHWTDLVPAD
eukprot:Nitzschia sp. Nitz4//scaffold45_size130396//35084//36094//NITZ4_003440-RA/size130396-processed-gene-0.213-mRNA-1//-1//CDS//3329552371//633//frame0